MLRPNKNYTQQVGAEMFQYEIISPVSKHGDEEASESQSNSRITDPSFTSSSTTAVFDIEADHTVKPPSGLFVKKPLWQLKNRSTLYIITLLLFLVGIVISLLIVVWILSSQLLNYWINEHKGANDSQWDKFAVHSHNG
jgi:hypothetical protein